MEVTPLFKATVKALKARHKAQGLSKDKPTDILKKTHHQKSDFSSKAHELVKNVSQLRKFLLEHRKSYISASSHLLTVNDTMTDTERDKIDADAQVFIRTCQEAMNAFKQEVHKQHVGSQEREHREVVLHLMDEYLKEVCRIYSEQRAVRVKRAVDRKRIEQRVVRVKRAVDRKRISRLEPENKRSKSEMSIPKEKPSRTPSDENVDLGFGDSEELTAEEAQMFEEENQQLLNEMNSLVDEVKNIEGKVVEISHLQQIFTEKVLEQEKDIDRISHTVVGTTENIKDANEDIREAMKNNAGFRVWILFFLVMCSFSLLFLDWFND